MSGFEAGQAADAEPQIYSRRHEKNAAMRRRICDAATAHLAEFGFHRTSTARIAERAGVSQGALQHHYSTKDDLIVAIVERTLTRSVRWFSLARAELALDPDAFAEIVRRSWREQFCSADYAATLEILAACRTCNLLRARITPALERWRAMIDAELTELLPATRRTAPELQAILSISRAMMTGLVVHDVLLKNEAHIDFVIDHWITMVRR